MDAFNHDRPGYILGGVKNMTINSVIERIRSPRLREQLLNIAGQVQNMALLTPSKIFYVWKGGDNSTGENWTKAFTTIAAAITAHTAYRATQTNKSVDTFIIIAPGEYDENIVALPYSCTMIGLGVLGTDKATEIHPTTGSCMAGTVSGLRMYNISFQSGGALDTLDFNILHCSIIEGCEFMAADNDVVSAISTQCGQNVIIRNNYFHSMSAAKFTNGIYATGGADKYFSSNLIEGNFISGLDAGGKGIYIASDAVAGDTRILNNIIVLNATGVGIDDDTDQCVCVGNYVFHNSGTAYDYNAALAAQNIANDNGTVTDEPNMT